MQNPSNLPAKLQRTYAFRDSDLSLKFSFPVGYNMSGLSTKLFYGDKYRTGLASLSIVGQVCTVLLTKEDFKALPIVFDLFLYKDGLSIIGNTIEAKNTGGIPTLETFNVTLGDATEIVVEVVDAQLIGDSLTRAETAAENAEANKVSTDETLVEVQQISDDLQVEFIPKISNDLSEARRVGDDLYNVLDQYTGESITYRKVNNYADGSIMSPDKVDGTIYVTNGSEYFADSEYLSTGVIKAAKFGLSMDGVTDNLAKMQKLISVANLGVIVFPRKKRIFLSDNIHINFSVEIDMNGCELIAPKGFIDQDTSGRVQHLNGGYFTTIKGNTFINKITSITDSWKIGNVVVFQSNTDYIIEGAYKHGQLMVVQAITTDKIYFNQPFYENYTVDSISIYSGENFKLSNGTINMKDNTGSNRGITVYGYRNIIAHNVHCVGALLSECGLEGTGDYVEFTACSAIGYLNSNGFSGSGSSGRKGYGFSAVGNYVTLNNCVGNSCKHLFCSGNRLITSLYISINSFQGFNPPEGFADMAQLSGGGPLYQHMIDAHANVLQFFVNEPVLDGCNGMIAIRNGWAIINNPVMRSRSVNVNFNNTYLINAYEHQIENIVINNPTLYVDPKVAGQTELPTLFGIQGTSVHGNNKSIRIVNPNFVSGGHLFRVLASTVADRTQTINLEMLSITGIRGKISGGVTMLGADGTHMLGNIGTVELEGNVEVFTDYIEVTKIIDANFIKSFKTLRIKGYWDFKKFGETDGVSAARVLHSGAGATPIQHIDCNGIELHCGGAALSFANNVNSANYGTADFRNSRIYYNYGNNASANGIAGNLNGESTAPDVGVWDFSDSKIIMQYPLQTGPALVFNTLSKLVLDNFEVTKNISTGSNTYMTSRLALGIIPKAFNSYTGSFNYVDYTLKGDNKLYIATNRQTNPTLATAIPNFNPLYAGLVVYNSNYNGTTPYGWVGVGSTWKILSTTV